MNQPPPVHPAQPKKGNAATCWIVAGALGCVGVIAIAVLAGFMFPVAEGVMKKAEQANAENTVYNLRNSISAFFTEYREFPISDKTNPAAQDVSVHSNADLMPILMGNAPAQNPRSIRFFSGMQAKPGTNGGFRKGYDSGTQTLYDPWGNPYRVIFDNNMDNRIDSPATPGSSISATILIWSAGPDGDFKTWEDNIKTW